MRGQQHFIEARLHGKKPVLGLTMTLDDVDVMPLRTVQIERKDSPRHADLRFVVGLNVTVHGRSKPETFAWCEACYEAGAESVAGNVFDAKGRSLDAFVIFKTGQLVEVAP